MDAAARKSGDMELGGFDVVLSHFAENAAPMNSLDRCTVSVEREGAVRDSQQVYEEVLGVFGAGVGAVTD